MTLVDPRAELDGCRVLITRPAGRAETLCRRLRERGAEPIWVPLLEIAPPDGQALDAARRCIAAAAWEHIVFVSVNAVRFGVALLRERGCLDGQALCYAVGPATATALRERGVAAEVSSAGRGAAALAALPTLKAAHGQRVLIMRGGPGDEVLAKTLGARGVEVRYCDVYARAAPRRAARDLRAAVDAGLDVVTISSWSAWKNFELLLGDARRCLRGAGCCAVGARAAAAARAWDVFAEVDALDDATDRNLLDAIVRLWRSRR